MRFRERPASDIVVIGILIIVGLLTTIGAAGILTVEVIRPSANTDPAIEAETEILAVLVGALVGFVGGRAQGRNERDDDDNA